MRKQTIAVCLAAGLLAVFSGPGLAAPGTDHGLKPVPGSFMVTVSAQADRGALRGLVRAFGGTIRYEYTLTPDRINIRNVPPGAEAALAHAPGVVSVTPDFQVTAHLAESTPLIGDEPVVAGTSGGAGVNVCVLDTGINPNHLQFDDTPSRIAAWKDFVSGQSTPFDDNGHGSNVASIVAGREGLTVGGAPFHGVAPAATLYIGKVLDGSGSGSFSDVIAGIEWCAGMAADSPSPRGDVLNMSLGAGAFSEVCDSTDTTGSAQAVNAAAAAGVLVVTSAGNEKNTNAVGTPACASGAMAIGATYDADVGRQRFLGSCQDRTTAPDQLTCFSNKWDFLDVVAPGCIILGADNDTNNMVVGFCGTSQASPHVAGLAALVLAANPGKTASEIRDCINLTALDLGTAGFDRSFGNGRIQAPEAVACNLSCTITENPEVSCNDSVDNDCDGLIDAADPDCATCTVTENPEVSCNDGIDNDCDGLIDAADPDCAGTCSPSGQACVNNSECCSGNCKGKPGSRTCK
ncbi:MAG: S8 family serine peptidase [Acidobacteriota bacterium]